MQASCGVLHGGCWLGWGAGTTGDLNTRVDTSAVSVAPSPRSRDGAVVVASGLDVESVLMVKDPNGQRLPRVPHDGVRL